MTSISTHTGWLLSKIAYNAMPAGPPAPQGPPATMIPDQVRGGAAVLGGAAIGSSFLGRKVSRGANRKAKRGMAYTEKRRGRALADAANPYVSDEKLLKNRNAYKRSSKRTKKLMGNAQRMKRFGRVAGGVGGALLGYGVNRFMNADRGPH